MLLYSKPLNNHIIKQGFKFLFQQLNKFTHPRIFRKPTYNAKYNCYLQMTVVS